MKRLICRTLVLGLCLLLTWSASASLVWDTSIVWQKDPTTLGSRLYFGLGFGVGADGLAQVGGETANTASRLVQADAALTDGWAIKQSYWSHSGVRNAGMARLPNGDLFFTWDGSRTIDNVVYRNPHAFYDAATGTWSAPSYTGTATPLSVPRPAAGGNALTDMHIWGVNNSRPTYATYDGSAWGFETILDSTAWHGTNYQREGAFTTDSAGRPVAMVYNRASGVNALQLFTRTGSGTWVADTVTPSVNTHYTSPWISSAASFALYNDVPYVVYMDFSATGDGRRGQLYLTYKDGADWSTPILLDTTYLTASTVQATANIVINEDGTIAIAYTYLEKTATYPLDGSPDNPAVGETRFIYGDAATLLFEDYCVVPTPVAATYDAYYDTQVVFDYNDPLRVHLIQRTNEHSTSGGNKYRDTYYATTVLPQAQAEFIPEPATLTLLGLGVAGLVSRLRRRRN